MLGGSHRRLLCGETTQEYSTEEQAAAERAVAAVHLRRAGSETADWLVSRADAETLPGHLKAIVETWADGHPNAAGEWLAARGKFGPHTDAAVGHFATTVMQDDLVSAYAWARMVTDPQHRFDVMAELTSYAARYDPATARAIITEAQVDEEQAARLLEILK